MGDEWKVLAPSLYRRWCSYVDVPQAPASAPTAAVNDAARETAELQVHAEFANWLDTVSERLAGATPRAAAGSPELRPRLVELLRELEAEYERRLTLDEPAFDPSLLWDDLGLRELRDGPRDHPPRLGVAREPARQGRRVERASRALEREWVSVDPSSLTRLRAAGLTSAVQIARMVSPAGPRARRCGKGSAAISAT